VNLLSAPPQAYSFNVYARSSSPGSSIIKLSWQFGDGSSLDVPYCCQSQVSETQFHIYSQNGTYTVSVVAYDNMDNFGYAQAVINWTTPVPEYSNYSIMLLLSTLLAPILLRRRRAFTVRA
jgi:PKD repeat protein